MSLDMWTHEFCLACDRQVQVDGDAYCSEACRMADFEKSPSSTPSSQASSPGFPPTTCPWSRLTSAPRPAPTKFYLSPAYDFSHAQPYGSSPSSSSFNSYAEQSSFSSTRNLTPSSSHSSLCSIQSVSSTTSEAGQLSDKARMELRAYAVSFEQVRLQRRRSY